MDAKHNLWHVRHLDRGHVITSSERGDSCSCGATFSRLSALEALERIAEECEKWQACEFSLRIYAIAEAVISASSWAEKRADCQSCGADVATMTCLKIHQNADGAWCPGSGANVSDRLARQFKKATQDVSELPKWLRNAISTSEGE